MQRLEKKLYGAYLHQMLTSF